jgi:hypothetical protein
VFMFIVFCLMALLLLVATSATLYLGVFKAGKPGAGMTKKFFFRSGCIGHFRRILVRRIRIYLPWLVETKKERIS